MPNAKLHCSHDPVTADEAYETLCWSANGVTPDAIRAIVREELDKMFPVVTRPRCSLPHFKVNRMMALEFLERIRRDLDFKYDTRTLCNIRDEESIVGTLSIGDLLKIPISMISIDYELEFIPTPHPLS